MTKTRFGLTGNQLKFFALIAMTVDHIGLTLFPEYTVLRLFGRLAMPIFAWMIAEGCRYTKNRARYLFMMLGIGVVSQAVSWLAAGSLHMNILLTFFMSILLIYVLDLANDKKGILSLGLMGIVLVAITYICVFLPRDIPGVKFSIDYGICGVFLPVAIYIGKTKREKLLLAGMLMVPMSLYYSYVQWFAFLSLPILSLYNGKRGEAKIKYLFYLYYPLHLAAIYGVAILLKHLK